MTKPQAREEAPAGRTTERAAKAAPHEAAIEGFAKANEISPKQLKDDLAELRKNAADPGKVRRPADPHFDAEVSTSANDEPHTFDREKPTPGHEGEPGSWCRRSRRACGVPVDPEINKMVDEDLKESEGKKTTKRSAPRKEKTLTPGEYKKTKTVAEEAFEYGDEPRPDWCGSRSAQGRTRHP